MLRVCLLGCLLLIAAVRPARAQSLLGSLADDLILITNRGRAKEAARTHQHLGPGPGSLEGAYTVIPGAQQPIPGEPPSSLTPGQATIAPPALRKPVAPPVYGALELPPTADEGPPNGLTLDQAIEQLIQNNPDLRTRFQDLTKADADIVSAGLRNNPFLFGNVGSIPYQQYSPQRPGGVNYEVTVIQPWDVNQKRKVRIRVAQSAKNVLECLYQDSVRLQIDNLYTRFLDVLAAREALRQQQIGLAGAQEVVKAMSQLIKKSQQLPPAELMRVEMQRDNADMAVKEAESALRQAKVELAVMLNLPLEQMACLEIRGSLAGFELELPCLEELVRVALDVRPDLNAYRLGVRRAQAEVQMARADRWADVFVLYTPWSLQDNGPIGAQNANSWSLGALVTLPLFNRNQGNISRAESTVTQTLIELQGRERLVAAEVQRAYSEFKTTGDAVRRFQNDILPRARQIRDNAWARFNQAGAENLLTYLNARKDYNDVVRTYLETTVRHRRSTLHLNTVLGQRLTP